MHRLCPIVLLALVACGDNIHPMEEPDAGEPSTPPAPVDAGVEPPPDAPNAPDADPTDEVCAYMPGTFNEENTDEMANYPVRFGKGQGLEISPDIRQTGLLELENAHISNRDVVEKRRGAVQLGDGRSATPGDVVPDADRRAIWSRNDEVILQTGDSIYREQTAIGTFTWSRVGSWIQARLRELYANTFATNVISADAAVLGNATLVAYQTTGGNAELAIYGESMAREAVEVITATPTRVRLSGVEDFVHVSYQDPVAGNPLKARIYPVGAPATVPLATIFATMPAAVGVWDVHGAQTDVGDDVTAWAGATPTAADITVTIREDAIGLTGTTTSNLGAATIEDVAVQVWPLRVNGGTRWRVAVAILFLSGGNQRVSASWQDFSATTGAFISGTGTVTTLTDATSTGRAIAVSFYDRDTMSIAVEQDDATTATRKVSYFTANAAGVLTATGIVHFGTALKGQGAIVAGTPVDSASPAERLGPGFPEQLLGANPLVRSGWLVFAPRTGEVLARSLVGFTGDTTTRALRPPKGSFVRTANEWVWAGPAAVPSEPGVNLRAVALCKLDRTPRANKPANLDDVSISAHAGYPRFYDGITPAEHDWHTLPQIRLVTSGVAGGTTTAGEHRFAVTWEADDANGLRYRSAPSFEPGAVSSGGGVGTSAITVQIEPMTHTERRNVRAVLWMTTATLPGYYRAAEAAVTGAVQTLTANISDVSLATREQLDQAAVPLGTGVQPSQPARVTDFVAQLVDRVASRDPRVGSLLTFSTPSRESSGFATHWTPENVLQEALDRDVTSALEVDGRVLVASKLGFSQLQGDGPDATGEGSFGIPLSLRAAIGIEDHTVTERTPLGYAFGSVLGPRLLTPSLTVENIDEAVERQYAINGGHVVGVTFDPAREEIVWLDDSAQTLRLNTHNGRWASDSNRLGRDLTRRRDGTVYILRSDGKVLKQAEDVYADGAAGYSTTIAFRLREPSKDGVAHGGFVFNGLEIFGEYVGPHAITATVTLDFRDGTTVFQGTVPQQQVIDNAAAGGDYRYVLYTPGTKCYAARCELTLSSTTGQTARIDGIDVRYNGDGSGDAAQVQEEQRFPLEITA